MNKIFVVNEGSSVHRLLCMDFGCHLATRWSHVRVCFIPMGTGPFLDPVYWGRKNE